MQVLESPVYEGSVLIYRTTPSVRKSTETIEISD
jgi:hypothetical protein